MCRLLGVTRSLVYYHLNKEKDVKLDEDEKLIEEILKVFGIKRSLSKKGSPYDNAVSEAVNKVMKTEFIYQENFTNFQELNLKLAEYVYWYNNLRIHGSLGYKTPVEYRKAE